MGERKSVSFEAKSFKGNRKLAVLREGEGYVKPTISLLRTRNGCF
jgi:hypothetical protein